MVGKEPEPQRGQTPESESRRRSPTGISGFPIVNSRRPYDVEALRRLSTQLGDAGSQDIKASDPGASVIFTSPLKRIRRKV